ncbi:MAG: response regulator [bacterium]|nr:response regulator [bacterium]
MNIPPQIPRTVLSGWDILVVEDEADSLDIAVSVLTYYGASVHTAGNGQEALHKLETLTPRLIISDLSMPVMSGWALIEHLNQDRRLMSIPAIALTAHAMPGDREKAIAAGFHNHLTKPLTATTFIRHLLNLLVDIPVLNEELAWNGDSYAQR